MARSKRQTIVPASDLKSLGYSQRDGSQAKRVVRHAPVVNAILHGIVRSEGYGKETMSESFSKTSDGRPQVVVVQSLSQMIHLVATEGKDAIREMFRIDDWRSFHERVEKARGEGKSIIGAPFKTRPT